jgi:hypothetical protein
MFSPVSACLGESRRVPKKRHEAIFGAKSLEKGRQDRPATACGLDYAATRGAPLKQNSLRKAVPVVKGKAARGACSLYLPDPCP